MESLPVFFRVIPSVYGILSVNLYPKLRLFMNKSVTPEFIISLEPNEIFVFGSNLEGMQGGVDTIRPYVDELSEHAGGYGWR